MKICFRTIRLLYNTRNGRKPFKLWIKLHVHEPRRFRTSLENWHHWLKSCAESLIMIKDLLSTYYNKELVK